jgi:hypothetical protein
LKEASKKELVKEKETVFITREGKEIPVSLSIKLRKSPEGEILGYFLGFFDFSQIKIVETQLKEKLKNSRNLEKKSWF